MKLTLSNERKNCVRCEKKGSIMGYCHNDIAKS